MGFPHSTKFEITTCCKARVVKGVCHGCGETPKETVTGTFRDVVCKRTTFYDFNRSCNCKTRPLSTDDIEVISDYAARGMKLSTIARELNRDFDYTKEMLTKILKAKLKRAREDDNH